METCYYIYVKDYSYLKHRKKSSLKRGVFLLALGMIIGVYFTIVTRTRFSPLFVTPLPTQSLNPYIDKTESPPKNQESQFKDLLTALPTPTVVLGPTLAPALEPSKKPLKDEYTIALLGDSMIDTAGEDYPALAADLKNYFPKTKFKILNYGVGANDIEYGLFRLTNDYKYLGEHIPSLLSQNPDVIVIESFAYNHWSRRQKDLDRQWFALAKIVETIRVKSDAKIVFLATIAPNSSVYAQGVKDLNWSREEREEQVVTVRLYLQNFINFATSQTIPLVNAFGQSLDQNGEGKLEYINATDFLHPSARGHELVANLLSLWIKERF